MFVVSDATPLHYLVLIGEIELLTKLYGTIRIPVAVAEELSAPRTPLAVREWISALPTWASVASVRESSLPPFEGLGQGELQAIAMARENAYSIVLTDDARARLAAESVGIQTVPTIRILSTAAALSLVDLQDALDRLQRTNFRVSAKVIDSILKSTL